jgi:putative N6-adenine-specific DNA methylase
MAFEYQQTRQFFAQVANEVAAAAEVELAGLGAEGIRLQYQGILFRAEPAALYRVNYCSRLITRVYAPLAHFVCRDAKTLYKAAYAVEWEAIFSPEQTFAVVATVTDSEIRHSGYAALCAKDAIVDRFRDLFGQRPNVDAEHPQISVNLFIQGTYGVINLDTSGGSLHKRGYRRRTISAPMQESVAAAIIQASGWMGERPLYDPFCGSGTLLCEAFMHYCRIPAGFLRSRFGFEHLPDFDDGLWRQVKTAADAAIRPLAEGLIAGSDSDARAVEAAQENLECFSQFGKVLVTRKRFQEIDRLEGLTMVCNPPYGLRLGDKEEAAVRIKEFGDFLKQRCTGSSAYVYLGDRDLIKKIGLHPGFKMPLRNGGLEGRLCKFEMYAGERTQNSERRTQETGERSQETGDRNKKSEET